AYPHSIDTASPSVLRPQPVPTLFPYTTLFRSLAIEYDGGNHRDRLVEDNRRQNLLINAGFRLLRFTASDVHQRPDVVTAQVRDAFTNGWRQTNSIHALRGAVDAKRAERGRGSGSRVVRNPRRPGRCGRPRARGLRDGPVP